MSYLFSANIRVNSTCTINWFTALHFRIHFSFHLRTTFYFVLEISSEIQMEPHKSVASLFLWPVGQGDAPLEFVPPLLACCSPGLPQTPCLHWAQSEWAQQACGIPGWVRECWGLLGNLAWPPHSLRQARLRSHAAFSPQDCLCTDCLNISLRPKLNSLRKF